MREKKKWKSGDIIQFRLQDQATPKSSTSKDGIRN